MAAEQRIQSKIMNYLREEGHYAVKIIAAGRKGVPDILACVQGRFFAFEVKAPGGKPTDLQKWNLREIGKAGGVAGVVYSVEDVEHLIKEFDNDSSN